MINKYPMLTMFTCLVFGALILGVAIGKKLQSRTTLKHPLPTAVCVIEYTPLQTNATVKIDGDCQDVDVMQYVEELEHFKP